MKILFITDNFTPEVNAPATRTYEHCREWVKKGIEVTVITGVPNFPEGKVFKGYENKLIQRELIDGIKVVRVFTYITENSGFTKRILDYISFGLSSFLVGLFIQTDIIVATTPQFFTALSGRYLSFFKRKPWVMEVRDIWPESIKTVGMMKDNLIIKYFEWLERRCYHSADKIIVVTKAFKLNIIDKGINETKIEIITNGANLSLFKPIQKNDELLNNLGLKEKIIFGYIGTLGLAHKLDFVVDCFKKMDKSNVHLLIIGSGSEKRNLHNKIVNENVRNVTMIDSMQKKKLIDFLSILDVSIINLKKDDLFKTVIPSKIFENAAMQIPILLGVDGEARGIVEEFKAGLYYEPESETDFMNKINRITNDKEEYTNYKAGGSKLAFSFDRTKLAKSMLNILRDV